MEVMVTQTWSWLHQQLDYPKYKWIKIHALKDGYTSYCGLTNRDDTGDMEEDDFINNANACKKCKRWGCGEGRSEP